MKKSTLDTSDARMLELIEKLKRSGEIRFTQTFLDVVEVPKQNIYNIKIGKQHFTIDQIKKACKEYNVNANWILGLEKEVFRVNKIVNKSSSTKTKISS